MSREHAIIDAAVTRDEQERVWEAFRRWGYLQANLDPLGDLEPVAMPELNALGPEADAARSVYCGNIGVEFMHMPQRERRQWIQERMESEAPKADQRRILDLLVRGDIFEQTLQSRYLGTKRFSLEGVTALLPLLDSILSAAVERGAEKGMLAMSHRGRLNVMLNIVGRVAPEILARFEDVAPRSILGCGDVKYHQGATGDFVTASGKKIEMHLVSNPSHLEAVDPVLSGRTRAKQMRRGKRGHELVLPISMHGDAAFAGQGVWAETLNMADIPGYTVGGQISIIVNNLIGFTTLPGDSNSTRFASDLAKRLPIPVFHVNAEDAEAVVRVGKMALDYRYTFESNVVIDLVGYRRHGHSEVDDPTITQPRRYRKIEAHPQLYRIYAEKIGVDPSALVKRAQDELDAAQKEAVELEKSPAMRKLPSYWNEFYGGKHKKEMEVETAVAPEKLKEIGEGIARAPRGFHVHPKVQKLLEQRVEMANGKRALDYGMAEALAFGSLLTEGVPVRLTGQDSRRGTFNQRHAALVDNETEEEYLPLQHLAADQAWCEIYNSPLSEAAVLGFEFGFSRDFPEALVLWEAQFGDFANGAQIIIDQFISSSEDKWNLLSGLVMLLPHGYEGQGPEHSSARIERYLQLTARHNMQICQPSTAAQYFHMLRRQGLRKWRKPLIVFTPKSMLRHPSASSPIAALASGRFQTVIPDQGDGSATRVLLCTGKIGHELMAERKKRGDQSIAIVSVEQLYPFPHEELAAEMDRHEKAREFVWVQEEPGNMGALSFVLPRIERLAHGRSVLSVKRSASASPATGSHKAHEMEQKTLIAMAFATTARS